MSIITLQAVFVYQYFYHWHVPSERYGTSRQFLVTSTPWMRQWIKHLFLLSFNFVGRKNVCDFYSRRWRDFGFFIWRWWLLIREYFQYSEVQYSVVVYKALFLLCWRKIFFTQCMVTCNNWTGTLVRPPNFPNEKRQNMKSTGKINTSLYRLNLKT